MKSLLVACLVLLVCGSAIAGCRHNTQFLVGAGSYDITGPAAERGMMGYAEMSQRTAGILQRDWARTFVIKSPCNGKTVVLVTADLAMLFQGVQQAVLQELKKRYGNEFNSANVVLAATHQHSGAGGYATHALYNLSTLGFDQSNFHAIVHGIVESIALAKAHMQPATITIARGQLTDANVNRSPSAYLLNPKSERAKYRYNRDTTMTLLRFTADNGKPIGLINWFPVHGTSLNKHNHLISGDNKGYAAYRFEQGMHARHQPGDFVAAFAQANAGDISPNLALHGGGSGLAGRKTVEKNGGKQYQKAKQLYAKAKTTLVGGVNYRQQYVAMWDSKIKPQFSNKFDKSHSTCPAAFGESMMAGTTDGETGFAKQGITDCNQLKAGKSKVICKLFTHKTLCQGIKPILLQTNKGKVPLSPRVLPFSIVTIGDLAIVVNPFELTTMAGRRVRNLVAKELKSSGVKQVVLACYANGYGGYVTTPQEYQKQRYEGASNMYGPRSLNLQLQAYHGLAQALIHGKAAPKSAAVPDTLNWSQKNLLTPVIMDNTPSGRHFGEVLLEPKASYQPGQVVTVKFQAGDPRNNLRTMGSFLAVEHKIKGKWVKVDNDNDWSTSYHWERAGLASSIATVTWYIPKHQVLGEYRIVQYGDHKSLSGKIRPYVGVSRPFTLR
jgi:neutral ceramidase